jgi:hypothetical protein
MKLNCAWKIIRKHFLQIPWLSETPRPLIVTLHHAQTTFILEPRLIATLSWSVF